MGLGFMLGLEFTVGLGSRLSLGRLALAVGRAEFQESLRVHGC